MSKEFVNPDAKQKAINAKKHALILIQGAGQARAGVWSKQVAISENFELGTMLPQLDWAVKLNDYAVLVMNPNQNKSEETGKRVPLNETMSNHATHIWKNYVLNSGFEEIFVIAFSAGGNCLTSIM